ncbi:sensor histidine kinase [Cellulosilyticum sp. I15G10I2]|uniref:sensor histidine kinase n=1 Tax=Cellulosilyticum sp. I15G10I2 TaxID=1892843 RepID=UPI00085BE6BB|nr:sensor histidine kinase [Cellulosilyticum sp. I15G10I2]
MANGLLWHIFEYSIFLIDFTFVYLFLKGILDRNLKVSERVAYVVIFSSATSIFALSRVAKFSAAQMIGSYLFCILIAFILFKGRALVRLFWATMYIVGIVVIESMIIYVSSAITKIDVITLALSLNWYRIVFCIFSKLVTYIYIRLVGKTTRRSFNNIPGPFYKIIIAVFCVSTLSMLFIMRIGAAVQGNRSAGFDLVYISIGILVLTITLYQIFQYMSDYFEKENQYHIMQYQNEVMMQTALDEDATNSEVRKILHDFNNHISCIDMLLQMNSVERARKYISDMQINSKIADFEIKTGNEIADAVINQKYKRAKKHNIQFKVEGQLTDDININAVDLCSLMSNALDNAIEANLKVSDESLRAISVEIEPRDHCLFLEITNTVEKNITNTEIVGTTKEDKKSHGFGMLNMKTIAEKYQGHMNYVFKEDTFNLSIMLKAV